MMVRLPALVLVSALAGSQQVPPTPDLPVLREEVHAKLVADYYMDQALALLDEPRTRVEMHDYVSGQGFFFLLMQPAGDVTIDEFRPTGEGALQSLTLTIENATETVAMVHVLIRPEFREEAEVLARGALDSVDQGGARQTKLYLLGVHASDNGVRQVLLREETSTAGDQMFWIHYR